MRLASGDGRYKGNLVPMAEQSLLKITPAHVLLINREG